VRDRYFEATRRAGYVRRWVTVDQVGIPDECAPTAEALDEARARVAAQLPADLPFGPPYWLMESADGSLWECLAPATIEAYRELAPATRLPAYVFRDPLAAPPAGGEGVPAHPSIEVLDVSGCRALPMDRIPAYPRYLREAVADRAVVREDAAAVPPTGGHRPAGTFPFGDYLTTVDGSIFRIVSGRIGAAPAWLPTGYAGRHTTAIAEVVPAHSWCVYPPTRLGLLLPEEERLVFAWRHDDREAECRHRLGTCLELLPAVLLDCYFAREFARGMTDEGSRRLRAAEPPAAWDADDLEFD
jgi:hypothetical protein